jgi:excisionase family DNA binding protein
VIADSVEQTVATTTQRGAPRRGRCGRLQARMLTPVEVAEELGVDRDKVLAWVKNGELSAVNLATKANGRPRYAIDRREIENFLVRRLVHPRSAASRRQRRRHRADVIQFF